MRPVPLLILVLLTCTRPDRATTDTYATDRPNIVFILADDLGYGDLGSYGQQLIATPNLDRLASEGMRFTRHYAGSTVCAPSRSVLMTGLHTGHTFVRGNWGTRLDGGIPDSVVTLAEELQTAAYATTMIGKWGLGVETSSGEPDRQGFDHYYGYLDQVLAHNYYPEYLLRNGEREYLDNEPTYLDSTAWHRGRGSYTPEPKTYSQDKLMDEATTFLDARGGEPFFLYLPFALPHGNGEQPFDEQYEIPSLGHYADRDWTPRQKGYAAMVSRLDADVGRILDRLDSLGLRENTLVVFTSDNGPVQDGEVTDHFDSNGPLRGGKRDMYEGGIRVPLIVRWPGRVREGSVSDHPSAFWDWLPTLTEVAGIEDAKPGDGISFLPTLLNRAKQDTHDYLYWEFPAQGGKQAVLEDDWKALRLEVYERPDGPWQLYNLNEDIQESQNIAAENPEIVARMDSLARAAHTPSQQFPFYGEPITDESYIHR